MLSPLELRTRRSERIQGTDMDRGDIRHHDSCDTVDALGDVVAVKMAEQQELQIIAALSVGMSPANVSLLIRFEIP